MTQQQVIPWPQQRSLDDRFEEWLRTPLGRHVYEESARRALRLQERGVRHYGIKGIWESIRFDWMMSPGRDEEGFKVNNNYHSRMARKLMDAYPCLRGFFELRRLTS